MKLRTFYSMPQIAEFLGVHRSRAKAKLLLFHVPVHKHGRMNIVFASDLQMYAPELYLSILELAEPTTSST